MNRFLTFVKKVPKKISGGAFISFLVLSIIAWGKGEVLKKIEIGDVAGIYNTINNMIPDIHDITVLKIVCPLLAIISALFYVIRRFYKENVILIKHSSLSTDVADVDSNFLSQYRVNEISISQFNLMLEPYKYDKAIELQDNKAKEICTMRQGFKLCYYGIAHTPLIFRLGYKIGDENNIILLHKKRNNEAIFEEFESTEDYSMLINSQEYNESIKSQELLVSIATSLPIKVDELVSLCNNDKHYLRIESQPTGFDLIFSYRQAERLRNEIMQRVRETCKKHGIKRIHLTISSSSAFTFFLAQAFSPQHDPEIIVYHYLRGDYPWGIIMHKDAQNAVVFSPIKESLVSDSATE